MGLDLEEKILRVLTFPIELNDTYLGPFRIVLRWQEIGDGSCYDVVADDPHTAEGHDDVTHPHVSGNQLCEGDGATDIRKALAQGRLLDFFTLVKQILETYNPDSAHVALSRWHGGVDCYDCGDPVSEEESWGCSRCSESVCDSCRSSCEACEETLCSACCIACRKCDGIFCRGCLEFQPGTLVLVCTNCLEKGEESDEAETPADDPAGKSQADGDDGPAPPADSLRLEEALVPA